MERTDSSFTDNIVSADVLVAQGARASAAMLSTSFIFNTEAKWCIYTSVTYATTGSDNGLLPVRCQAIIWTNAGILLIGPLRTNFTEILIEKQTFPFKKMHLKMSSAKYQPFCLDLNALSAYPMPNLAANPSVFFIIISKQHISFNKIYLKVSFTKSCPFCLGLNVLKKTCIDIACKKSGLSRIWAKFVIMMPSGARLHGPETQGPAWCTSK